MLNFVENKYNQHIGAYQLSRYMLRRYFKYLKQYEDLFPMLLDDILNQELSNCDYPFDYFNTDFFRSPVYDIMTRIRNCCRNENETIIGSYCYAMVLPYPNTNDFRKPDFEEILKPLQNLLIDWWPETKHRAKFSEYFEGGPDLSSIMAFLDIMEDEQEGLVKEDTGGIFVLNMPWIWLRFRAKNRFELAEKLCTSHQYLWEILRDIYAETEIIQFIKDS